jgi:hypothetical protein
MGPLFPADLPARVAKTACLHSKDFQLIKCQLQGHLFASGAEWYAGDTCQGQLLPTDLGLNKFNQGLGAIIESKLCGKLEAAPAGKTHAEHRSCYSSRLSTTAGHLHQ